MNNQEFGLWAAKTVELSDQQLDELNKRIALRKCYGNGNGNGHAESAPPPLNDWVFEGLFTALRNKGLTSLAARRALMNTKGYKQYQKDIAAVMKELETLLPKRNTASAKYTLAYLVGNALVKWCITKRLPNSASFVLSMVCHAREALELSFPNYISSNMFHVVFDGVKPGVCCPKCGHQLQRENP